MKEYSIESLRPAARKEFLLVFDRAMRSQSQNDSLLVRTLKAIYRDAENKLEGDRGENGYAAVLALMEKISSPLNKWLPESSAYYRLSEVERNVITHQILDSTHLHDYNHLKKHIIPTRNGFVLGALISTSLCGTFLRSDLKEHQDKIHTVETRIIDQLVSSEQLMIDSEKYKDNISAELQETLISAINEWKRIKQEYRDLVSKDPADIVNTSTKITAVVALACIAIAIYMSDVKSGSEQRQKKTDHIITKLGEELIGDYDNILKAIIADHQKNMNDLGK